MSKKCCFRRLLDNQHGKRAIILLKSLSEQFYHIYWKLSKQLSWKKSPLLTCQVLGLLVSTVAAGGKYPVLNTENLTIPLQMQLSQKQKCFSQFFSTVLKFALKLNILKKKMTLIDFLLSKLRTMKRWLVECLKSPVSEDPLKRNMVTGSKHGWNLHHSNLNILIEIFQGNWVGKSFSYWHDKSWDCLLTHWLSMTSILFLIGTF